MPEISPWEVEKKEMYKFNSFLSSSFHGRDASCGVITLLQFEAVFMGHFDHQPGSQLPCPLGFPSGNKDSWHWLTILPAANKEGSAPMESNSLEPHCPIS